MLHLTGYDLPLDQIKQFRQWGNISPGHPERGVTPGVETTTGPLGQGFGNGVGMAISEAHLAARYNRPGFEVVDRFTYGLVSDGDLMVAMASGKVMNAIARKLPLLMGGSADLDPSTHTALKGAGGFDFGASAPAPVLMREYGFTVENACKRARALREKNNA